MTATNATETRSIETTLEINAPVEAVWKALTDPEEIARWFSPRAQVKPGVGGTIRWTWDETIDWESRIEIWEADRHLRAVYDKPPLSPDVALGPALLAMDFTLEARAGTTVLRLVHSGFGQGSDWDEEYDGVRRGWGYELGSLRHYLEHHRGKPRQVAWARVPIRVSQEEAWRRLMGPQGLTRRGTPDDLREGGQYDITASTGDSFRGEVLAYDPPKEFGATVVNLNNSLLRVAVEKCGGPGLEAWVWVSTYGLPQADVDALQDRWQKLLETLFAETQ